MSNIVGLFLAVLFMQGCTSFGPPIQEMSDARLALTAAEQAGGDKFAPVLMRQSRTALLAAEAHLAKRAYSLARNEARAAKSSAVSAREMAETAKSQPHRFPEQPIKQE